MCSIVEDDFGDDGGKHSMVEENKPDYVEIPDEICKKCNTEKVAVKLYLKDAQCENCFLFYARHKFRATLGASKVVRRGANVLVIFDGSPENMVMMDMIKYGLEQEKFKKLNFQPFVLYLDEFCIQKSNTDRNLQNVKNLVEQFKFPTYYGSIGSTDYCKINDENEIKRIQMEEETYLSKLNKVKSKTSQQDLVVQTKNRIYKAIARKLDCGYIFLSDITVDLAKKLLIEVALGRGSSVADSFGFCDNREPDRKILKPMRDLLANEIIEYIKLRNLEHLEHIDQYADGPSIQNLTSGFVEYLQTNFPSTVTTVFRTGDAIGSSSKKNLNLREDNSPSSINGDCNGYFIDHFKKSMKLEECLETNNLCWLCKSKLDNENSFALDAQKFSKHISANNTEGNMPLDDEKKFLCHGCKNIFDDLDD